MPAEGLSVIVPTRGRPAVLRRVLSRVFAERGDPPAEVIVVHDGESADPALAGSYPGLVQLETGGACGPAAARNLGASRAGGGLLVFLDDDVEPAPGALSRLADELRGHPGSAVVARIEPAAEVATSAYVRFAYGGVAHGGAPPGPVACTRFCSSFVAIPRRHFREAGGFDVALRVYEDVELGYRLARRGVELRLSATAEGYHHREMDRAWFVARCEGLGPHLRKLHRLHPELAAVLPVAPRGAAAVLCVGGRRAWRLWKGLLPAAEVLPWPVARACLRAVHLVGTTRGYRGCFAAG